MSEWSSKELQNKIGGFGEFGVTKYKDLNIDIEWPPNMTVDKIDGIIVETISAYKKPEKDRAQIIDNILLIKHIINKFGISIDRYLTNPNFKIVYKYYNTIYNVYQQIHFDNFTTLNSFKTKLDDITSIPAVNDYNTLKNNFEYIKGALIETKRLYKRFKLLDTDRYFNADQALNTISSMNLIAKSVKLFNMLKLTFNVLYIVKIKNAFIIEVHPSLSTIQEKYAALNRISNDISQLQQAGQLDLGAVNDFTTRLQHLYGNFTLFIVQEQRHKIMDYSSIITYIDNTLSECDKYINNLNVIKRKGFTDNVRLYFDDFAQAVGNIETVLAANQLDDIIRAYELHKNQTSALKIRVMDLQERVLAPQIEILFPAIRAANANGMSDADRRRALELSQRVYTPRARQNQVLLDRNVLAQQLQQRRQAQAAAQAAQAAAQAAQADAAALARRKKIQAAIAEAEAQSNNTPAPPARRPRYRVNNVHQIGMSSHLFSIRRDGEPMPDFYVASTTAATSAEAKSAASAAVDELIAAVAATPEDGAATPGDSAAPSRPPNNVIAIVFQQGRDRDPASLRGQVATTDALVALGIVRAGDLRLVNPVGHDGMHAVARPTGAMWAFKLVGPGQLTLIGTTG